MRKVINKVDDMLVDFFDGQLVGRIYL